jgi:hypothetical protein
MREKATSEQDSASGLTDGVPWDVVEVRALSDHSLTVRFADGTQGEVEMAELLASESPGVFAVLRDPMVFRQVGVEHGAVTWPGEIDLAPDSMYDDIRRNGRCVPYGSRSLP